MKRWFATGIFFSVPIFIRVCPLARPRFRPGSSKPYQPMTRQAPLRKRLAELYNGQTYDREFFLNCHFTFDEGNPGDIDNLLKSVLDGLQAAKIISNDRLCVGIMSTMNMGSENFVVIELERAELDEVYT